MLRFLCVALTRYQRLMPQRKPLSWFMVWGGKAQDQAATSCGTVTCRLHSVVRTHVRAACVGARVYRRKTKERNGLHNSLCIQCQSLRPNSLPRYLHSPKCGSHDQIPSNKATYLPLSPHCASKHMNFRGDATLKPGHQINQECLT